MIVAVKMHVAFQRRGKDSCMQWSSTLSHYNDSKLLTWVMFHTEDSAKDTGDNDMGNMITQLLGHPCLCTVSVVMTGTTYIFQYKHSTSLHTNEWPAVPICTLIQFENL